MTSRTKLSLLVGALAASQLGSTDCGQITRDPGFDLWCGEELCSWKLARGDIRQVPTWHEGDDGVELLGDDVAIYQLTPVTWGDARCVEFTMIADVELGPDVRFQVDVWGDGSYELDEAIPQSSWRPLAYRFAVDGRYNGIRFQITKRGGGHAVVAQLDAHVCDSDVTAGTVLSPGLGPSGDTCYGDETCAGAMCVARAPFPGAGTSVATCGECSVDAPCTDPSDVCGLAFPPQFTLDAYATCVPAGSKVIGQACAVHEECGSGICAFGVCSACFGSCAGGERCDASARYVPQDGSSAVIYPAPLVCAPSEGRRAAGEACSEPDDCASGACAGPVRRVCSDGRACNSDGDCPILSGLDHELCATVGVLGGTCQ